MLIISNSLNNVSDEGCLKVAASLVSRIKKAVPEALIVTYERRSELSDIHFEINNKLMLSKELFSLLRKHKEEIIYIPFPARPFATALRIFILSLYTRKKPKVISVMKYRMGIISKILLRVSGADFVVFSKEAEDFYDTIVGEKHVSYLKTGVDTQKFVPVSKEKKEALKEKYGFDARPVILHVGHLNRGRNVAQLMKLDKKYQILLVTSTLTKNEQDIELKNELLKSPNIKIIDDYIPHIEEVYQLSDAYFFPVVEQGRCIDVPLSVMEAASCNKPIITTDFGEMKQFRGKKDFYFIESFDENELNALAEKALACEDAETRSAVLDYDWKNAVSYLTKI